MKIGLIGLFVLVVAASSLTFVVSGASSAADKPQKKMTLSKPNCKKRVKQPRQPRTVNKKC
jgi:hypothetical protein